jgi:serine protease Do
MMIKRNLIAFAAISLIVLLGSCAHRPRNQQFGNGSYGQRKERSSRGGYTRSRVKAKKPSGSPMEGPEIFKRYSSAVFMVFTSDGFQGYQGSGFFIDGHGLAVSNYHVFKGTSIGSEQIKLEGSDVAHHVIEVIAKDEDHDFIVFRVNSDRNNYLDIAANKPEVGEKVFAIGSPRGLENTFSSGEVSQWRTEDVMQINVQIDHGSSGGPLFNQYGQVVGITSGTFYDGSQANLNYAWSIDVIKGSI